MRAGDRSGRSIEAARGWGRWGWGWHGGVVNETESI